MRRRKCLFPRKKKYSSLINAYRSLIHKQRRPGYETLSPYKCGAHWHLGNNGVPYSPPSEYIRVKVHSSGGS